MAEWGTDRRRDIVDPVAILGQALESVQSRSKRYLTTVKTFLSRSFT